MGEWFTHLDPVREPELKSGKGFLSSGHLTKCVVGVVRCGGLAFETQAASIGQ